MQVRPLRQPLTQDPPSRECATQTEPPPASFGVQVDDAVHANSPQSPPGSTLPSNTLPQGPPISTLQRRPKALRQAAARSGWNDDLPSSQYPCWSRVSKLANIVVPRGWQLCACWRALTTASHQIAHSQRTRLRSSRNTRTSACASSDGGVARRVVSVSGGGSGVRSTGRGGDSWLLGHPSSPTQSNIVNHRTITQPPWLGSGAGSSSYTRWLRCGLPRGQMSCMGRVRRAPLCVARNHSAVDDPTDLLLETLGEAPDPPTQAGVRAMQQLDVAREAAPARCFWFHRVPARFPCSVLVWLFPPLVGVAQYRAHGHDAALLCASAPPRQDTCRRLPGSA